MRTQQLSLQDAIRPYDRNQDADHLAEENANGQRFCDASGSTPGPP
ncbi:MAG: hypothetical protein KJZ93_28210 [Caldilineaceae bacterium]|nr:hypothetical protein [Caldilineaceae bacterium]